MIRTGAKRKRIGVVLGWTLALAITVLGALYLYGVLHRDLKVMLYLDGEPLCCVEDKRVTDEALLLLSDRLAKDGIREESSPLITYRYLTSGKEQPLNAEACMALLYERTLKEYCRAYMITLEGLDIAACATYEEADKVVNDFRDYVANKVMSSQSDADLIELTTEFEIRSVFCRCDRITSGDDIYRVMVGLDSDYDPNEPQGGSDSRVTAVGSLSILYADKNGDFGLIRNPSFGSSGKDDLSLNMSGLNSAIGFNTVIRESYSEFLPYEVIYVESDSLYVGESEILVGGENGIAENVYEITYSNGVEIARKLVSSTVIAEPTTRVERIGTKERPPIGPTGTFIWPLDTTEKFRISSYYGVQRDGFESKGQYHKGVDLCGPELGSPIYAADGGVVTYAGTLSTYGLLVRIRHEDGVETYYAHQSKIVVEVGDVVYQGQKIGEIGRSGTATGVHLHFEVRINKKTVNPLNYLPDRE